MTDPIPVDTDMSATDSLTTNVKVFVNPDPVTPLNTSRRTLSELLIVLTDFSHEASAASVEHLQDKTMSGAEAKLLIAHFKLHIRKYTVFSDEHNGVKFCEGTHDDPVKFNPDRQCGQGIYGSYGPEDVPSRELRWRNFKKGEREISAYWVYDMSFPDDATVHFESSTKLKASSVILSNKRALHELPEWSNIAHVQTQMSMFRNSGGDLLRQSPGNVDLLYLQLDNVSSLNQPELIKRAPEALRIAILAEYPNLIRFIDNPSWECKRMALSSVGSLLELFPDADDQLQAVALTSGIGALAYAVNPRPALVECALRECRDTTTYILIEHHLPLFTPDMIKLCASLWGTSHQWVMDLSDAVFTNHVLWTTEQVSALFKCYPQVIAHWGVHLEKEPQQSHLARCILNGVLDAAAKDSHWTQWGDEHMETVIHLNKLGRLSMTHDFLVSLIKVRPQFVCQLTTFDLATPDLWNLAFTSGLRISAIPVDMRTEERCWAALKVDVQAIADVPQVTSDMRSYCLNLDPDLIVVFDDTSEEDLLSALTRAPGLFGRIKKPSTKVKLHVVGNVLVKFSDAELRDNRVWVEDLIRSRPFVAFQNDGEQFVFDHALQLTAVESAIALGWDYFHTKCIGQYGRLSTMSSWSSYISVLKPRIISTFPQFVWQMRQSFSFYDDDIQLAIKSTPVESRVAFWESWFNTYSDVSPFNINSELWSLAVESDANLIRFNSHPAEDLQLLCVTLKPSSIQYIKNHTSGAAITALRFDPTCKIPNPSPALEKLIGAMVLHQRAPATVQSIQHTVTVPCKRERTPSPVPASTSDVLSNETHTSSLHDDDSHGHDAKRARNVPLTHTNITHGTSTNVMAANTMQ